MISLFLVGIMPSSGVEMLELGGNVAERLRGKMAYGWVERCSNIAGCRTIFFIR